MGHRFPGCLWSWLDTHCHLLGVPQTDESFGNVGGLGTVLVLLEGITNKLSPEAMLDRYIFYFVNEGIIEYLRFNFNSKRD